MTTTSSVPVASARAVRPVLQAGCAEADRLGHLAPDVLAAMRRERLFLLPAPAEVGGLEASLPDVFAAMSELAAGDATVAWHAVNSQVLCAAAAHLAPSTRDAIFDGPAGPFVFSAVATDATATAVPGGFELTGRWPFATGSVHAPWLAIAARIVDTVAPGAAPDVRFFLVPHRDIEIEPTWQHASAMRGTGSNAVTVTSVFVPDERVHRWTTPLVIDKPFYRLPTSMYFYGSAAAVITGLLRAALDGAVELGGPKQSRLDGAAHADRPRVRLTIAAADAAIRSLTSSLTAVATDVWDAVVETGTIPIPVRQQAYATIFSAFDIGRRVVSDVYQVTPSVVFSSANAVETALRNVHAISTVFESLQPLHEEAGAVRLGRAPTHPRF